MMSTDADNTHDADDPYETRVAAPEIRAPMTATSVWGTVVGDRAAAPCVKLADDAASSLPATEPSRANPASTPSSARSREGAWGRSCAAETPS